MKPVVALFFGGKSVEHEVSVITGLQAYKAMDTEKYDIVPVYMTKENLMYIGEDIKDIEKYKNIPILLSNSQRVILINDGSRVFLSHYPSKKFGKTPTIIIDVVFPAVHGTNVEDGALQGYFKTLGVPFVGCDVTASAIGMDKYIMKTVLKDNGIPVLDCKVFNTKDYENIDNIISLSEKTFGYPVIVKPVNLGSSVGIGLAHDRESLLEAIDDAFLYSTKILIEKVITNLREINCSVLGDENEAKASECEEPFANHEILSYEDKYMGESKSKGTKSSGMASLGRKIPADISSDLRERIRSTSVQAFKALGCSGVARIDFMIDTDTNDLYFNEINTIPGSLSFYLWEATGVSYTELLNELISLAMKRQRTSEALTFSFDVNILESANLGGGKKGKL